MNYGPSYASEFYHYLKNSQILESFISEKRDTITIISLGCGFAPDIIAIDKYIKDKSIRLKINYIGIDKEISWGKIRIPISCAKFECKDLLNGFDLSNCDIVVINKMYSTLRKNNISSEFLSILKDKLENSLPLDSYLLFIDINSKYMGRDEFDSSVYTFFRYIRRFYVGIPPHTEPNWIKIPENTIVFSIPDNLSIGRPLMEIRKNVFFEYRK